MNRREALRRALMARDQHAFVAAMARFDDDIVEKVAHEELARLDYGTRAWWATPQEDCDGTNCAHDHQLVATALRAKLAEL